MSKATHKVIIEETIVTHYDFDFDEREYKNAKDGASSTLGMFQDTQGEWVHGKIVKNETKVVDCHKLKNNEKEYTYKLIATAGNLVVSRVFTCMGLISKKTRQHFIDEFLKDLRIQTKNSNKSLDESTFDSISIKRVKEF